MVELVGVIKGKSYSLTETLGWDLGPASHYQVDLTGTPEQVRLSGLPDT
jgi:hypothetical protein